MGFTYKGVRHSKERTIEMNMNKLWSGRLEKPLQEKVQKFTASSHFDKKLYKEDIRGSCAHVKMLSKCSIITRLEAAQITRGLKEIEYEIEEGLFDPEAYEDIHSAIEIRLAEKIGPLGGKLHTARSRNDQVALDEHLYLKKEIQEIIGLITLLQQVLKAKGKEHEGTVMPGYTHMQRAQPITLKNHLMAYYYKLERDKERFQDCLKRTDVMPLGAGALAGSSFPIDKEFTASLLGFEKVYENTLDAVSDRDYILEFMSATSILMVHLSGLCEELILWSTKEFDFVELDDSHATGSSIMPQKKNPDVAELIRGKTGRVFGALVAMLTVVKALPLAYNRDIQEDKEQLFDVVATVKGALDVLPDVISMMKINTRNMEKAVQEGFLDATELADELARKGIPFREAHEIVGRMVCYCIKQNKELKDLTEDEMRFFSQKCSCPQEE